MGRESRSRLKLKVEVSIVEVEEEVKVDLPQIDGRQGCDGNTGVLPGIRCRGRGPPLPGPVQTRPGTWVLGTFMAKDKGHFLSKLLLATTATF